MPYHGVCTRQKVFLGVWQHGHMTAVAGMSVAGDAVAFPPRGIPTAGDDNNVLRRAVLGALVCVFDVREPGFDFACTYADGASPT